MDRWRRRGRVQEEERLYLHLKEDRSPSYHAAPACACKEEVEMRWASSRGSVTGTEPYIFLNSIYVYLNILTFFSLSPQRPT